MYDAKKKEQEEGKSTRFEAISDRGYFYNKIPNQISYTKSSYVPKENLFS